MNKQRDTVRQAGALPEFKGRDDMSMTEAQRKAKQREEMQKQGYVLAGAQVRVKRAELQRMRKAGYKVRAFLVHDEDWPRVSKYLERVNARRGDK